MAYFYLILIIGLKFIGYIDDPAIRKFTQLIFAYIIGLFIIPIYNYLDQLLKLNPFIFLIIVLIVGTYSVK